MEEAPTAAAVEEEIERWRRLFEAERAEMVRSDKVLSQFEAVRQSLQQKCDGLDSGLASLQAAAEADPEARALQVELAAASRSCEQLEEQAARVASDAALARREAGELESRAEAARERRGELLAETQARTEARGRAEAECEEASRKSRSMVMADALERASEEAGRLQGTVAERREEAAKLRQALADSWASRGQQEDSPAGGQASWEKLDDVEEKLQWLASAQQNAAAEMHHLQGLERSEAALQARLRELAEEKAALQSARLDHAGGGTAMREAIAVQSETYVTRVSALEAERRFVEADRKKLLQECADMQDRLTAAAPELAEAAALETSHEELRSECGAMTGESKRLREVNAALGALLLGDEAASMADAPAQQLAQGLSEVVDLLRRFVSRTEEQEHEKDRLTERIRALERDAAQNGVAASQQQVPLERGGSASRKEAPAAGGLLGGGLSSATSALRGGWGRLRDAALDAI